jgi:anti-anti-sigma regulatory factor
MVVSPTRAVFHVLHDPTHGFALVEVEGMLGDRAVVRWAAVLKGTLYDDARRVVLDLRGCNAIEPHCLTVLLSLAAALRASGGSLTAVTVSGSPMERFLQVHAGELPKYASVHQALTSWQEASYR